MQQPNTPKEAVFPCKFCSHSARFKAHLKEHGYQKHNYCSDCDETFENRFEIVDHLVTKHKQNLHCQHCNYSSLRQRELQIHITKVHPELEQEIRKTPQEVKKMPVKNNKTRFDLEQLECKFCAWRFRFMTQMTEHYYQKHFYCFECQEQCSDRNKMLQHLAQAHKVQVQCDFCGFNTMKEKEVLVHMKKCHEKEYLEASGLGLTSSKLKRSNQTFD